MGDDTPVTRVLNFWQDGFSVDDGPLMRYEDPANKELLEALNEGRAPLSLLGIKFGQRVDLQLAKRMNEKWRPPPPAPTKPFTGSGNRLGAPTSELSSSASTPPVAASTSTPSFNLATPAFEIDSSQPVTTITIRLGSGERYASLAKWLIHLLMRICRRLTAKFNESHTVGDIVRYINAYVLAH